jgi:UDP-N-acetyl-D-mannosaminuronic acid transferase (WecB/TagA/CpsF family)
MIETRPFLGIPFSTGTIDDVAALIVAAARAPRTTMLVTPNVHHVVALDRQLGEAERHAYRSADLFLCDSKVLGRLARRDGLDLTPRTGTDRVADVLAAPGNRDLVIALAGPRPEQTEALRGRFPDWRFLHIDTPARLVRGTPEWTACVAAAAAAPWQILLSCLSFPKQELFAADVRAARTGGEGAGPDDGGGTGGGAPGGGVILCVGAAVDFLSGTLPRAPMAFQRFGLEWLFRLLSDPLRLWRRYLVDGPKVFLIYRRTRRRDRA